MILNLKSTINPTVFVKDYPEQRSVYLYTILSKTILKITIYYYLTNKYIPFVFDLQSTDNDTFGIFLYTLIVVLIYEVYNPKTKNWARKKYIITFIFVIYLMFKNYGTLPPRLSHKKTENLHMVGTYILISKKMFILL